MYADDDPRENDDYVLNLQPDDCEYCGGYCICGRLVIEDND